MGVRNRIQQKAPRDSSKVPIKADRFIVDKDASIVIVENLGLTPSTDRLLTRKLVYLGPKRPWCVQNDS